MSMMYMNTINFNNKLTVHCSKCSKINKIVHILCITSSLHSPIYFGTVFTRFIATITTSVTFNHSPFNRFTTFFSNRESKPDNS